MVGGQCAALLLLTILSHRQKGLDDVRCFFFGSNLKWCLMPKNDVRSCSVDKCVPRAHLVSMFVQTENCLSQKNCHSCNFRTLARPPATGPPLLTVSTLPRIGLHYHANMLSTAKYKLSSRGTSVNHTELLVGLWMWKNKLPRAVLTQANSSHFWLHPEMDPAIPR